MMMLKILLDCSEYEQDDQLLFAKAFDLWHVLRIRQKKDNGILWNNKMRKLKRKAILAYFSWTVMQTYRD